MVSQNVILQKGVPFQDVPILSEKDELVAICDRFNSMKHSTVLPYAFTEQGIAMLSGVLNSLLTSRIKTE